MFLSDDALSHLRRVTELPDLSGTKYRLKGEIARGGMGLVFLAEDTELGREVAIKVLSPETLPDAVRDKLRDEARLLARLEHPNIVPVYDSGALPDGRVFYAMRLVRGRTLDEYLRDEHALAERLRVFGRICDAVSFAHSENVIHRDLKPSNVMVGAFGEVFVLDWGIARAARSDDEAEAVAGTPGWMAPEQLAGGPADRRTDVYGLGAILLYLLQPSPPRRLVAIARKAMSAHPDLRYGSGPDLMDDILRYQDGLAVKAYRETAIEKVVRVTSNNKTLVVLVAAYIAVRVIIYLFSLK
jgi:eukaryotic-like serine/threonine-protein kinase